MPAAIPLFNVYTLKGYLKAKQKGCGVGHGFTSNLKFLAIIP
jgi:hypothetical protein